MFLKNYLDLLASPLSGAFSHISPLWVTATCYHVTEAPQSTEQSLSAEEEGEMQVKAPEK